MGKSAVTDWITDKIDRYSFPHGLPSFKEYSDGNQLLKDISIDGFFIRHLDVFFGHSLLPAAPLQASAD